MLDKKNEVKEQLDRIEKRISDIEADLWILMKFQETDYSLDPLMSFVIKFLSKKSTIKILEIQKEFNIGSARANGIMEQLIKLEYITNDEKLELKINKEKILKLKSKKGNFDRDLLFNKVSEIIREYDLVSSSLLQRKLSLGYARAARLLDQLEEAGLVGPAIGAKPREVIKKS